jgi:hypothetical protein
MADFTEVYERLNYAKGIAWDTCHKIYILMDDEQMALMKRYEYDPLISANDMSVGEMFETVKQWYDESCGLRFVDAVSTVEDGEDPNNGFEVLIGQGEDDEEEEEEEY